jgi:dUTP pyrophosphatase
VTVAESPSHVEAAQVIGVHIVVDDPELRPSRAHATDAGWDLRASARHELAPGGGRALVGTGVRVALPPGTCGLVIPRSGLAARHGVTVLNAPGLIDAGYRGEILVPVVNTDPSSAYEVDRGDRIAQLVVMRVPEVAWAEVGSVDDLPAHDGRGDAGHGSSGR